MFFCKVSFTFLFSQCQKSIFLICFMSSMFQFPIKSGQLGLFRCIFSYILPKLTSIQCDGSIWRRRLCFFLNWTHRHSFNSKRIFFLIGTFKEGCCIHRNTIYSCSKPIFSSLIIFKQSFFGSLTLKQTYTFLIQAMLNRILDALFINFIDKIKIIFRFNSLHFSINGALIQIFLLHLLTINTIRRRLAHIFIHILLQCHTFCKSWLSILAQGFRGFTHPIFYLYRQQNENQLSLSSSVLYVCVSRILWVNYIKEYKKNLEDTIKIVIYYVRRQKIGGVESQLQTKNSQSLFGYIFV